MCEEIFSFPPGIRTVVFQEKPRFPSHPTPPRLQRCIVRPVDLEQPAYCLLLHLRSCVCICLCVCVRVYVCVCMCMLLPHSWLGSLMSNVHGISVQCGKPWVKLRSAVSFRSRKCNVCLAQCYYTYSYKTSSR